jgi:phenylpropionate dioxygenase-like ring-hydroxylating dioxygenase large terminal subunit
VPVLFSHQLPDADCPPVRVKVLSERLVAFRTSDGKVGLVDERCPHRGASMFFGRNEENGLRCVYHGWKFDAAGRCLDMPSEPPESNFRHKVRITAYPCLERGGLVWAYMGPTELKPEFPDLEWTGVPDSHRWATRHIQECNWFQALEGGFDTSHLTFLHSGDIPDGKPRPLPELYEVLPTDFGMVTGSGRKLPDGSVAWTVNCMGMPFHKVISRGGTGEYPIGAHVWVPIDDENCMIYSVEYRHDRPLGEKEMERSKKWLYIHAETEPGTDRCVRRLDNDFLIDRALQKSGKSYTGLTGFGVQDCGIQESMGPIVDRTLEHLGVSDTHIIKLRRQMLRFVKDHEAGKPVPGMKGDSYQVRSAGFTSPPGVRFEDAALEQVRIETHLLAMAK